MRQMRARASAIGVACFAMFGVVRPAAAQHEHHGAPAADSSQSALARLAAVTATAERDAVVLRSGATIVDARASAAAGGSVADLLRAVPGLELDADGRIRMRGSAGVLVLVNGRRITLSGDALAAFLRQMPASALERVEAGTAVSARDAEGAGVVNLVFRDDALRRTSMRSLSASMASDDHYMGSATATGDLGTATRWDAMYSLSGMRPPTETRTARWSVVPGDLPLTTEHESRGRESHHLHAIGGGAEFTLTPAASLTLHGAWSRMSGSSRERSAFSYTNEAGDTASARTAGVMEHLIPSGEGSVVARVERGSVRIATELRASGVNEDASGVVSDVDGGYAFMTTVTKSRQRERVLRNDVGLRVGDIALDVGQESRWRTITGDNDATHFNATLSRDWRHELDVQAGYVTARRSIGGVRAEAGMRVESERVHVEYESTKSRSDVRFFPGVSAEWFDADRALRYRLAYSRRITRPDAGMLSPFAMGPDHTDSLVGNPALAPELSDQLELGVERHHQRLTLQLTPWLRWVRDPIRQLKGSTASGGAMTRFENLHSARSAGADVAVGARPADGAVVTLTGTVAHMETSGDDFTRDGVYAFARLTVDLELTANTTAQLYAYRRSAQVIEQGEIIPLFTSDLALTHRVAGTRLTLRLNDPWRSERLGYRVADNGFSQQSSRRTARPLLSLFACWAVGGAPREDAPVRREDPGRIF